MTVLHIVTSGPAATETACVALAAVGLTDFGAHSCGPTVSTEHPDLAVKALHSLPSTAVYSVWQGSTKLMGLR